MGCSRNLAGMRVLTIPNQRGGDGLRNRPVNEMEIGLGSLAGGSKGVSRF